MVIINSNNIRIEREGNIESFRGKSVAKSFRSWIASKKGQASKKDNLELVFILNEIERAYNHFHPEKITEVEVDSWKGKSSFEVIKQIDRLIIIKFQRKSKGEEPSEIQTEIGKDEIVSTINSIKELGLSGEGIKTRDLAKSFCMKMNYNEILSGNFWEHFFSNRPLHNRFTLLLGALDKLGFISYKGGVTKLLNQGLSIQLVLNV
jgi:hypothetical protein